MFREPQVDETLF